MSRRFTLDGEELLTAPEVAALFRVDPKTVARWVAKGYLSPLVLPSGRRRFRRTEIEALLNGGAAE